MTDTDCTSPVERTEKTHNSTPRRDSEIGGTAENGNADAQPSQRSHISDRARRELREFFRDNPGAYLTIDNVAMKLGVEATTARSYLSCLTRDFDGMLERVSVYRLRAKE